MIAEIAGEQYAYRNLAELQAKLTGTRERIAERRRKLADEDRQLRKKDRAIQQALGPRASAAPGAPAGTASTPTKV